MKDEEVNRNGRAERKEEDLSRHDSTQEQSSSSDYKFPKPHRRPKNDTKHKRERSQDQERELSRSYRVAGFPQARRVPGSGALAGLPADVDPGSWFLGEAKQTRQGRLTIDPEWVDKIRDQSARIGRPWWVLHAWVAGDNTNFRKLVILDEQHFFEIIKRLKAYEDMG